MKIFTKYFLILSDDLKKYFFKQCIGESEYSLSLSLRLEIDNFSFYVKFLVLYIAIFHKNK
ncbi:hypothetical protein BpHYR1_019763 [Brachionus plicatilis]|uniref:Uncharacterized protein n=1 Tax=Brachionus plicatilis TaxID=10195 RepID=A0A3M7PPJ1_BRAPC|nr:hypothetical protein BpHYR1_019763 [Brachionus plicatilis]